MCGNIACIAAVLFGVDVGWQPLPEGGLEYIVQIEPELLETLRSGQPIQSDLPSRLKDIRAYRIVVGTAELPRELPPEEVDSPESAAGAGREPPTDPFARSPGASSSWPNLSGSLPPLGQPEAQPPTTPERIHPAPDSTPIDAQAAGYLEQSSATPQTESKSPSEQQAVRRESPQETPEKPWTSLIVTMFTLFGSLGANLYLGWITWNTRSRYRSLVEGRSRAEIG